MWQDELIPMVRLLINDTGATLTYSDHRLEELICLAGKLCIQEIDFSYDYTITLFSCSISPDPVVNGDTAFQNFVAIKAACLADQGLFRTKAAVAGLVAKMGPALLDTAKHLPGFSELIDKGPCAAYERMKFEWMFGNANVCKVILSPFVSNSFDPQNLNTYSGDSRSRLLE